MVMVNLIIRNSLTFYQNQQLRDHLLPKVKEILLLEIKVLLAPKPIIKEAHCKHKAITECILTFFTKELEIS